LHLANDLLATAICVKNLGEKSPEGVRLAEYPPPTENYLPAHYPVDEIPGGKAHHLSCSIRSFTQLAFKWNSVVSA
jgi:hypothetical protein